MDAGTPRMYRHTGRALLRAAALPTSAGPQQWPDLAEGGDVKQWQSWLTNTWTKNGIAEAIAVASPSLARRVEAILAGRRVEPKNVRRIVIAVVSYVLRQTSRPTPFGLFAGVAPAEFGPATKIRWGSRHKAVSRADTGWLDEVVTALEGRPELLERLPVVINSLRSVRGNRLVLPCGTATVEIRRTAAVRAVERLAHAPIRFGALADTLSESIPSATSATTRRMLSELVEKRFLVTSLRSPATVVDPFGYVLKRLSEVRAEDVAQVAWTVRELRAIRQSLHHHNAQDDVHARTSVCKRMREVATGANTVLTVDLQLDCDVVLPEQVAIEIEAAALALLRLGAQPEGSPAWREYHAAFLDRYGIGVLVPVTELINPDAGLGMPAGYPGSPFGMATHPRYPDRDDRLVALVHRTTAEGRHEVILDEAMIRHLAGSVEVRMPSHIELSARIRAVSRDALDRGEFILTVSPGRAAGTMTGRFASHGLQEAFKNLPTMQADAVAAQLSFLPTSAYAENIARTARLLPDVITLGEHRCPDESGLISLADLAVTADWRRLYLLSLSRRRPVEPQVFHALALDRQAPAIARLLANLPRSSAAAYTEFDWGAAATLPQLPRVRYRRAVLSPARWRITNADLPPTGAGWSQWRAALQRWRDRWHVPDSVNLRDADRVLRLDLTESAHVAILRAHLNGADHAVLTEALDDAGLGWLDGHAHEVVVPLVLAQPAQPCPALAGRRLVQVSNSGGGHLPGSPDAQWLYAKIYLHQDRQTDVIASQLPRLLAELGDRPWWFLRYRDPTDGHHLRLRIRVVSPGEYGSCAAVVGAWAGNLRRLGLIRRLVFDTYEPEVGRFGIGPALAAAESVFATDSVAVLAQLRHAPPAKVAPHALTAASMVNLICGFTGSVEAGMAWLVNHADPLSVPIPRDLLPQAISTIMPGGARDEPGWTELARSWHARDISLAGYRRHLSNDHDAELALESLLHLHHVRALGLDRDSERVCRRLARSVALARQATRQ